MELLSRCKSSVFSSMALSSAISRNLVVTTIVALGTNSIVVFLCLTGTPPTISLPTADFNAANCAGVNPRMSFD